MMQQLESSSFSLSLGSAAGAAIPPLQKTSSVSSASLSLSWTLWVAGAAVNKSAVLPSSHVSPPVAEAAVVEAAVAEAAVVEAAVAEAAVAEAAVASAAVAPKAAVAEAAVVEAAVAEAAVAEAAVANAAVAPKAAVAEAAVSEAAVSEAAVSEAAVAATGAKRAAVATLSSRSPFVAGTPCPSFLAAEKEKRRSSRRWTACSGVASSWCRPEGGRSGEESAGDDAMTPAAEDSFKRLSGVKAAGPILASPPAAVIPGVKGAKLAHWSISIKLSAALVSCSKAGVSPCAPQRAAIMISAGVTSAT
jgi:hypothetical protein